MSRSLPIRIVLGALVVLLFSQAMARAQAISPVIAEYQGKGRGEFQVSNSTLYPMDVVLEPFSFVVDSKGHPTYGPLEPTIHVRLSSPSFRLGPKQVYTVFYDATADVLPAWFTIYATVTRANNHSDVRVAFQLPHTVYILPKTTVKRDSVIFRRAVSPATGPVQVEVENRSGDYARVQEVDLITNSGKKVLPGFPFFPHQRRILLLEPDKGAQVERVVIKFPRFKVEQRIQDAGASP
jgi:P pilus assembly chaperone PapD